MNEVIVHRAADMTKCVPIGPRSPARTPQPEAKDVSDGGFVLRKLIRPGVIPGRIYFRSDGLILVGRQACCFLSPDSSPDSPVLSPE